MLLKQAISIANKVKANAILVNMETVADIAPFGKTVEKGFMVIFVTKRKVCLEKASGLQCETILLPDVHLTRDGYMSSVFWRASPRDCSQRAMSLCTWEASWRRDIWIPSW